MQSKEDAAPNLEAAAPADSLRKRYLYKLGGGFFGMAMGGIVQLFVPRALGPAAYGDYNFLSNFFIQVTNTLDMGTSYAFYTKLSARPNEGELVAFYTAFVAASSAAILGLTLLLSRSPWGQAVWPGQSTSFVMLGAGLGILLWIAQVANKATDAYGLTVKGEIARSAQNALSIFLIVPLFILRKLTLPSYFYCEYALTVFLAGAFIVINSRGGRAMPSRARLTGAQVKDYALEFYHYSHPLLTYACVGLFAGLLGRWLLQTFGGSVQQGFFGFSYQIGAACFLCTSAMTPLLMREFSIASSEKDVGGMARLFEKHIPPLYSITAYFACFVSAQSSEILRLFAGSRYAGATVAVALMALSPMHQTYGQLSGSLFYATGRTKLYRNIGVGLMLVGVPVTYFLLAPRSAGGLNLGAAGLALGTVLMQILGVNVQLYYNARYLGLRFRPFLWHQFASAGALFVLAHAASRLAGSLIGDGFLGLSRFIFAGITYTAAVAALAWIAPSLFGVTRKRILSVAAAVRERLSGSSGAA